MLHGLSGDGKVGVAPGTTTLTYRGGRAQLVGLGDDSGVIVRNASGVPTPPMSGGLGMITPTDFDLSKIYGYLPVNSGWISAGLGQNDDPQMRLVAVQAAKEEEHLKALRSGRVWGAVAGLVGVAGLIVSVIALRMRR